MGRMNEYRMVWKDAPAQWWTVLFAWSWVLGWALLSLVTGTLGGW